MSNPASTIGVEQRLDAAAAVHEGLPRRVRVDPAVHPLLVRQVELAVRLRAAERPVLRAEVGAVGLDDRGAVADGGVEPLEVLQRHLGLPLEHRVDVARARGRADVPLLDVADPARALQADAGDQRDVAEGQPAETAEERAVGRRPQALGQRAVVAQFVVADGRELLGVVGGIEARLVDRLLADDRVEEVAAGRHQRRSAARSGRSPATAAVRRSARRRC